MAARAAPLGLAAFGATTFIVTFINAGWSESAAMAVVLGPALFYGGLAQFLSGIIGFLRNDLFAGVALTSYGAFWMSYWFINSTNHLPEGEAAGHGVGLLLGPRE